MKLRLLSVGAVGALLMAVFLTVSSQVHATTATVSQAYSADSSVVAGMLVSIDPTTQKIVPTNIQNSARLLGVASPNGGALIEAKDGTKGVQVVSDGTSSVLVSTLNGTVKAGDRLGVSELNGIAQKVGDTDLSFGTAQDDFNVANSVSESIKLSNGQTKTLQFGQVAVVVTLPPSRDKDPAAPTGAVQRLADTLAGKPVSLERLVIAGLISITSLVSVFVLLYSSTRASILSIGRNPLAHKSIRKSLAQVMLLALGIIVGAQIVAVAVLRL